MERTVLITDADTPLGAELVRLFTARGCRIVAAAAEAPAASAGPRGTLTIPWNRRSAASAHNLLLSALAGAGRLDEALVLAFPRGTDAPLHEQPAAEIEKAFDLCLKPVAFLCRELVSHFRQSPGGVLSLASFSPRAADAPAPALERAVRDGFKGFASSLMASYGESGLFVNAFQSFGASPEEFAHFIEKTLEEKARKISGRWFTCQPKSGFIQGMFSRA